MHIDLSLVLEVLEHAEYRECVANLDVLVDEPGAYVVLTIASVGSRVVEVVQPEDAGDDAGRVIDAKEVLLILLDVEDNDTSDLYLCQQILIPK